MARRHDFSTRDKWTLARRVALRCSNPHCRKPTSGPTNESHGSTNIGVAAHITAAAVNGPRFAPDLSSHQRKSLENAIWLCQSCAKLVDDDALRYSIQMLHLWKQQAEEVARRELESGPHSLLSIDYRHEAVRHAQVLLPEVSASSFYAGESEVGTTIDYSVYPFVIEELIAFGASRVAVVEGTGPDKALPTLSKFMDQRVVLIDPTPHAAQLERIFLPIAEELEVNFNWPGTPIFGLSTSTSRKPSSDLRLISTSCAHLYPDLFKILLGMEHRLQIEIDLEGAKRRLSFLRQTIKTRKARDVLATLSGILACYSAAQVCTVEMHSPSGNAHLFQALLADQNYQSMGSASHTFGFPSRTLRAKRSFVHSAMSLLGATQFRKVLRATARILQLAAPDNRALEYASLYGGYLPPILPFDTVRTRAKETWLRLKPTPVPHEPLPEVKWGERW